MAAFKDEISPALVARLGAAFAAADPAFPKAGFCTDATRDLEGKELKARIAQVAGALDHALPRPFPDAARLVRAAIGPTDLDGWAIWPVTDWVPRAGLDDPDEALALLAWLTRRASAEFAVRPFIDQDPDGLLEVLLRWAGDPDEHVRRLASEGSRPRLPWGARLRSTRDRPGYALPVLDRLRADPSEYVRRSVANHLNDLTYEDRPLALATAARWWDGGDERVRALVRHGLRSLVKKGDPDALALLGVHPPEMVAVDAVRIGPPQLPIGGTATITLTVRNSADHAVQVELDYAVRYVTARTGSRKVFKGKRFRLDAGASVEVALRHTFRDVSIRTHRPGRHTIEVQVNGALVASSGIVLEPAGVP